MEAVVAHLAENLEHVEVLAGVLGRRTAALAACAVQAVRVEGDVRVRERRIELRLEEAAADARRGAKAKSRGADSSSGFVHGCLERRTIAEPSSRREGGRNCAGGMSGRRACRCESDHAVFIKRARHDDARNRERLAKNPRRAADTSQGTRTQSRTTRRGQ